MRSSRILFTTTLCQDLWISGATIYGEPPGTSHPNTAEHTDTLIQTAIDSLSLMPGLRFLAGDLNFELGSLECFERLDQLGFKDVQKLAELRWGITPQCTCKGSTRNDFLFISPELQQLFHSVDVIHDVWADHSVLVGYFGGHKVSFDTPIWNTPQPIDWPSDLDLSQLSCVDFSSSDPTNAYADLWSKIEAAAVEQARFTPEPIRKSQLGRGQTFDTYPRKGFPPPRHLKPSRKGDIQPQYEGTSAQHSQWFRQLRRVQAYCRFKKSNPVDLCNAHGASLWRSIVQAKGFQHGFPFWWEHHCTTLLSGAPDRFPLIPPGYDVAELIFSSLTLEVRSLENRLKASRTAKLRKQRAETAHLVFRDCKAEQPDRVDLFVSHRQSTVTQVDFSEQSITIDPPVQFLSDSQCFINGQESWVLNADPDILHLDDVDSINPGDIIVQTPMTGKLDDLFEAFSNEWNARWNRHLDILPSQWDQILAFSKRHLPSKQWNAPPISSSCIQAELLKKKKKKSSTGPDGVSLKDLLSMPSSVIDARRSLFDRAESDGVWPDRTDPGWTCCFVSQDF